MTSWSSWIPLLWILIIGTKSIAYWMGAEINIESTDSNLEGSPLDRNVFLVPIVSGAIALYRRKIDWKKVCGANPWLLAFFVYCGMSIFWSDYPFISFKRYIKDLGNIIMVLLILTEADPFAALRAVFARYSYLAVSGSLLLILFFPELGLQFDKWTNDINYIGVTTNKNELGIVLFICGVFLLWDLLEVRRNDFSRADKADLMVRVALTAMLVWLLNISNSDTALICLPIGAAVLILMKIPPARNQVRYLGLYCMLLVLLLFSLYAFPFIIENFFKNVGRDMTLSGRTDIWADLLNEPINPFVGTGYMSFWLGSAVERYDYIIQAHNGYLETYLNGGLIGLSLLLLVLASTGGRLKQDLLEGKDFAVLLFSFFVTALIYDLTEAMFNRLTLIWFILLVAILKYPRPEQPEAQKIPLSADSDGVVPWSSRASGPVSLAGKKR